MSETNASFEALQQALQSLYPSVAPARVELQKREHMLLLQLPNDVAAFSIFDGGAEKEFDAAYAEFRHLYRDNHGEWDKLTLSFVVCRSSLHAEDDRFYAALETDPLFCRKYVIRAFPDVPHQRKELLRLPFLPLPDSGQAALQRPQSAQDLLQSAGVSASLARKLIEAGHRSPERIATDLREGKESFPDTFARPGSQRVLLAKPRAYSKLLSATVEGFRAYRKNQEFDLNASVVVLYGPNGLGKTSFFDAIDYVCTGRIGRLCRNQQRTQTAFSELATHLDKTPGTGSVVLNGRTDGGDTGGSDWTLKRGTGDWSAAWIDGQEHDRKSVLTFLTHADWPEARPRQQTLESLFRATHLFGQDEQELLVEFRKASVIPEEFVSEMLALQDYSQGLSKTKSVAAALTAQRSSLEEQREQLQDQIRDISESLPATPEDPSDSSTQTPIDDMVDGLRQRLPGSGLGDSFPPEPMSLQTIEEWLEVIAARLRATEDRIALAMALRDELPRYSRLLDEMTLAQTKLAELEQEIRALSDQDGDLASRIDASRVSLQQGETQRREWERRRRDLRSAIEALAERTALVKQAEQLRVDLESQVASRVDLDSRLNSTEALLWKTTTAQTEMSQAGTSQRVEIEALSRLIDGFQEFEKDSATITDVRARLVQAEASIHEVEQQTNLAQEKLQEARLARESLLPEYERALSQQADLDQLLDSIQTHLRDASCPLCGSGFDSLESLMERIHEHRSHVAAEPEVTFRYKTLVASESQATDLLRVGTTRLTAVKANIDDLARLRDQAEMRIASYRNQCLAVLGEGNSVVSQEALVGRRDERIQQRQSLEEAARESGRGLKDLEHAKATDAAQRKAVNDRVLQLEREILALTDQMTQLAASVRQVCEREGISEVEMDDAVKKLGKSIDEALASTEHMQRATDDMAIIAETARTGITSASTRRDALLTELEKQRQVAADVRRRMSSLELADNATADDLASVATGLGQQATGIRSMIDDAQMIVDALKAREKRLQLAEKRARLEGLLSNMSELEGTLRTVQRGTAGCSSVEKLLRAERQASIEKHIAAYGPLITNIQQRLRSVYGFGGVQLEARGGEAVVQVEWRNKSAQVTPTDFFSDSQKQILMLSIFLAGGLRQNWSGFAPVLLDDPVTHFDDLNAYGFVELIRGIISSQPNAWQFIISTCEDRLFALMQKKFARVAGGAIFYEFIGMSEDGPMVERR